MEVKTVITVKRPNGEIEKVTRPYAISPQDQRKMVEATRRAGRGEILGFEVISPKANHRPLPGQRKGESATKWMYRMEATAHVPNGVCPVCGTWGCDEH